MNQKYILLSAPNYLGDGKFSLYYSDGRVAGASFREGAFESNSYSEGEYIEVKYHDSPSI